MTLDDLVYRQPGGPVHHTFRECPDGEQIPEERRIYDAGGLPLCSECKRLERGGATAFDDASRC